MMPNLLPGVHLQPRPPPPLSLHPLLPFRGPNSLPNPFSTLSLLRPHTPKPPLLLASAASSVGAGAGGREVDMVLGGDGVWSAARPSVVVLWDLDNKPPRGPPYEAAVALRAAAELFGRVVDVSAYANRHAFSHLPGWVRAERRERRHLDLLERKGVAAPPEPYACPVCGRKCPTRPALARHFRQLHERERQKKLARMRSLKGKKRERYRQRFVAGNTKYEEAARELVTPKSGYGLAGELRRAGVRVRTVEDKPQAADAALKRQMRHSVERGVDWLVLVSDDSDFAETLRRARAAELGTVVVGDGRRALGRHADVWVPWARVQRGEVGEEVLREGRGAGFSHGGDEEEEEEEEEDQGFYSGAGFDGDGDGRDLDEVVDEIVVGNSGFGGLRMSAFSEEEFREDDFGIFGPSSRYGRDLLWDSGEEDGYL